MLNYISFGMLRGVKSLLLISIVFSLASCNTSIGVWRDTKALSSWSVRKVKEASNKNAGYGDTTYGEQDYEYGAPVY